MEEFKDQIIIVTGGGSEIGHCIAATLAHLGAHVVVADVVEEEVVAVSSQIISSGGSSSHRKMDTTCIADVDHCIADVVREHGRVDALVNNAGLSAPHCNAWELEEEHWHNVINLNLNAAWWPSRAALRFMANRRNGRIVFITSMAARIPGTAVSPAYAAANAAIIGLTVSLSLQMERHDVLVNAIMASSGPTKQHPPEFPLGVGGPQPIADGVAYLLGRSGKWLSGSILNVSGGGFKGI